VQCPDRHGIASGDWWGFFDGLCVGSVPVRQRPELAEVRLVTEDGQAAFASLEVDELIQS
jgi:hypothetical protein